MKSAALLKAAGGIACAAFALHVGAQTTMSSDTASAPHETVSQHISDGTITTKVKAELLRAKDVKSTHIHVKTRNGVVHLTGTVPSQEDEAGAKRTAKLVDGVTSVKSSLKVVAGAQ
jgi:osmotically-inducible protein OsmY